MTCRCDEYDKGIDRLSTWRSMAVAIIKMPYHLAKRSLAILVAPAVMVTLLDFSLQSWVCPTMRDPDEP
jgi:hypothetical protein